jgi:hypothetical protein
MAPTELSVHYERRSRHGSKQQIDHGDQMKYTRATTAICASGLLVIAGIARATTSDEAIARFRATYEELVETNTTLSAGDCTLAATRMAARLRAAGYPESDLRIFVPGGHPKEGGLLAVLHGTDSKAKAILMLAHVDVVEAKREDDNGGCRCRPRCAGPSGHGRRACGREGFAELCV